MTINEKIKAQIAAAGPRFVSVTTITRNGAIVKMLYNPRELANRIAAQAAVSVSAAKGAETRAQRYPDLVNIWDVSPRKFAKYGKPGPSSFDLNNVLSVTANGRTEVYRQPREQRFEAVTV